MADQDHAPNVVFDGGPWHGWWLTRPRAVDNQRAATSMGHAPATLPGTVLNYRPTGEERPCPTPKAGPGEVWAWSP